MQTVLTFNPSTVTPRIEDVVGTFRNPRWQSPEQNPASTPVTLDCSIDGVTNTYVAHPNDPMEYGRQIWADAVAGLYGVVGPYQEPVKTVEAAMTEMTLNTQDYYQGVMQPLPPGTDRQAIFTEIQASVTVMGSHLAQLPPPLDRPITDADQAIFDQAQAAVQETIDYLQTNYPQLKYPRYKITL